MPWGKVDCASRRSHHNWSLNRVRLAQYQSLWNVNFKLKVILCWQLLLLLLPFFCTALLLRVTHFQHPRSGWIEVIFCVVYINGGMSIVKRIQGLVCLALIMEIIRNCTVKSFLNPLTYRIWLLILPSSYYTFPCKVAGRIWC